LTSLKQRQSLTADFARVPYSDKFNQTVHCTNYTTIGQGWGQPVL